MMISTKGRYALRVMLDLAGHRESGYIPLAEIAARQKISEKYLESILSVLSKAGMLDALRGPRGRLRRSRAWRPGRTAKMRTPAARIRSGRGWTRRCGSTCQDLRSWMC